MLSTSLLAEQSDIKAGSHRKDYEKDQAKDRLKTGEDYEILGKTFSILFKKTILGRYYLRFIFFPCLKPLLKPLVFHSLRCVKRASEPSLHRKDC